MNSTTTTEDRNAPGSALQSQAPAACLTGALLIFFALFQLITNDHAEEAFLATTGTIVVVIWALCFLGLLVVGAWASRDKREPRATLVIKSVNASANEWKKSSVG